jgi:hypothetical protein
LNADDVSRWLAAYVEAWRSYDPESIGALFSDQVTYRYYPHQEPLRGREAVVASWLADRDEPGTYDAAYRPVAIDGDAAVATGSSTYYAGPGGEIDRVYDNCFLIRFDGGGRCRDFTEWFMAREPERTAAE